MKLKNTNTPFSKLPDTHLVPLNFEDVDLNSWTLVLYEGERFLGSFLMKVAGQFKVHCLEKPYEIHLAQQFEREVDVVYYNQVYKAPVTPWATELDGSGNRARKTFYKY